MGKASGLDVIPIQFYKYGGGILYKSILAVFNSVLTRGDYPQIVADGVINYVYKNWENVRNRILRKSLYYLTRKKYLIRL